MAHAYHWVAVAAAPKLLWIGRVAWSQHRRCLRVGVRTGISSIELFCLVAKLIFLNCSQVLILEDSEDVVGH
jgi:hypothetical protein